MEENKVTKGSNNSEEESENNDIKSKLFFNKYKCIKKLGEGSFGMIYKAEYNGNFFALKFEDRNGQNLLEGEAAIMKYLEGPNIPYVKSYGYSGKYNILVMELLDKSLEDIFQKLKQFSIKSTCMLAYQMLNVLEYIHKRHIIHRDIKPDNFVMGLNKNSQYVYLLDFGLAKKYRSSSTLIQYPMNNKKKLTGTARYASINALKGYEQSRRDDLEAVGYVLMYLLRGSLPWQGLQAKNKEERYKKILQKKIEITSYDLCYGFPSEFERYVEYCKNLEYTEEPKYEILREGFQRVLKREHFKFDYIYDWTTEEDLKYRNNNHRLSLRNSENHLNGNINGNKRNYKNNVKNRINNDEFDDNYENNKKKNTGFSKGNFDSDDNINRDEERIKDKNNNEGKDAVCCSGCAIF